MKTINVSVHLTEELFNKLGEIAKEEGTTKAGKLRALLVREIFIKEYQILADKAK